MEYWDGLLKTPYYLAVSREGASDSIPTRAEVETTAIKAVEA